MHTQEIKLLATQLAELKGGIERDRVYGGLVQSKSPLSLTDKGILVLNESGGRDYIDNNKDTFIQEISSKHPKSSYDIQEFSKVVLEEHKDDEKFIKIKDYAFKKGILLDFIIMALSIYLRDFALEKLGFKIDDID